jgi:hypothetical protein
MPKTPKTYKPVTVDDFPAHVIGCALRWWRSDLRRMTLQTAAQAIHRDLSYLARWERAERPIPENVLLELDDLYGAKGRLVNLYAVLSDSNRYGSTVEAGPSSRPEDDAMERRTLMQLIPLLGIHTAVTPDVLNRIFAAADTALGDISHDPGEWEWTVYERWHHFTTTRPGATVPMLATDLLQVTDLLDKTQSAVVRDGLTRIAAQLAALMGEDLADLGQTHASRRAFATARRFADASSDRPLAAWVRGKEASYGLWLGRPTAVVTRLVQEAVDIADDVPSPGLMDAHGVRARLAAMRGDKATVRDAVAKIDDIWEQRPTTVDEGAVAPEAWTWARGPLGMRGYAYALLGEPAAARELDTAYERLRRTGQQGGARTLRLTQALHLVKNHDLAGLTLALETCEEMPLSAPRRVIASQILNAIPPQAKASEPAQRLRELVTASAAPAPGV